MSSNLRYLGLDVHADTIAVAVAEPGGEVRSLGIIPNDPTAVAKLIRKLGAFWVSMAELRCDFYDWASHHRCESASQLGDAPEFGRSWAGGALRTGGPLLLQRAPATPGARSEQTVS